jgi:hypothetical protein
MQTIPLAEQKLIYRVLHASLMEHTELMDSVFLHDLQRTLQKQAQADGVDVADHGAWDAWLGNAAVPCEVRVDKRRTISSSPGSP